MSKKLKKRNVRHRGKISEKQARFVAFVIMIPVITALLIKLSFVADKSVDAQTFVDLQEGDSAFPTFRRAHAKGVCVYGSFVSNGSLSHLSRADVFKSASTDLIGRFSIAGNNPNANDLSAPVRSLAFVLHAENNNEWRVAMNTPPVMAVKTPDAFYQQLQALSASEDTGKPDPAKIKAFFDAHPESASFLQWKSQYTPKPSFAKEQYHSINAFYLVDDHGNEQAVRFHAEPKPLDNELVPLEHNNNDALQQQLYGQLTRGPVSFDLVFTLANGQDDENDPSTPWPDERTKITAGQILIEQAEPQLDGQCFGINFNPLILPNGIKATQDPILRARSASYAESYKRRAQETLLQALSGDE